MRMSIATAAVALGCMFSVAEARAGVTFFVNDPEGFAAASASLGLLGGEDWSSGNSAGIVSLGDPLLPGVANGPFPNGVNPATGMAVQSNTLGAVGTIPSPGGNLAFAPAGYAGQSGNLQPTDQLSSNQNDDGLDLIFGNGEIEHPIAVAFSPMFYRTTGTNDSGTISVRVFDDGGGQLGTASVPNVVDVLETSFLGVVATESDVIGRVNLWSSPDSVTGADNILVYGAPEPDATLVGSAVLATLLVLVKGPLAFGSLRRNRASRFG